MMKVSDPIIFGQALEVFFADVVKKHAATFAELGVNLNNGLGDVFAKIKKLPEAEREVIQSDIDACFANQAEVYAVNSAKGISNFDVPSDVITDIIRQRQAPLPYTRIDNIKQRHAALPAPMIDAFLDTTSRYFEASLAITGQHSQIRQAALLQTQLANTSGVIAWPAIIWVKENG
jgi:hypothetical protein